MTEKDAPEDDSPEEDPPDRSSENGDESRDVDWEGVPETHDDGAPEATGDESAGSDAPDRSVALDDGDGEKLTPHRERSRLNRILTWILAIALVLALVGVVYVALTPPPQEDPFTEFYVLGTGGNASGYPTNLTVGETGEFVAGISNHEHERTTYTVALVLDGELVTTRTVTVDDGDTWEDTFAFTPESTGRQRLQILLYVGEEARLDAEPYQRLRLWVQVSNGTASGALETGRAGEQ